VDFELDARRIEDAAARLAGTALRTPLVGDPVLPGLVRETPADLRLKAENLQVGGGIWFRGSVLWLMRQLGRHGRGLVVAAGRPAEARAALCGLAAARVMRASVQAVFAASALSERQRAFLDGLGRAARAEWRVEILDSGDGSPEDAVRARRDECIHNGLVRLPIDTAVGGDEFAAGLATVGLELAATLPSDTPVVVTSDPLLVAPLRAGLAAGGRADVAVRAVPSAADRAVEELRRSTGALTDGLGLVCDLAGAAAVLGALECGADPVAAVVHE
jgi:threonine dehydratase